MPSFLTHALIGYLFFDYKGMIIALIPDFISYVYYFYKLSQKYDTYNFLTLASNATPNDLEKIDYQLYDTGHSLVFWLIALFIFKDKAIPLKCTCLQKVPSENQNKFLLWFLRLV